MRWMSNYLKDRYQRTVVDSKLSDEVELTCGVFQGAPLGPLLFIIYIDDIAHLLDKEEVFYNIYADDTVIVSSADSDVEAVSKNKDVIGEVEEWCKVNKILLNREKTKHMYIGPDRRIKGEPEEFVVNDVTIERVQNFKYLGVILDDKLIFDKNIERMNSTVNGKLISLARVRKYMDANTSLLLYKQMILPLLDYMCVIVDSSISRIIRKIQPLQNCSIKIILGINRYVSTDEMNMLHVQLSLMKLSERRKMFMLKMMYKYSQYEEYVDQYRPKVELRARPKVKMKVAFTRKERVLKSPYYLCNKLWDQLDHTVQNANTCYEFATAVRKLDLTKFML